MRGQAEFRLTCLISDVLRLRGKDGLHWFHIPNGEARSPKTGARLKRMGVKAGEPDFLLIWEGRAIGLELKAAKGRQSPVQRAIAEEWTLAGGLYHVATGYQEAIGFLEMLGVLKPDQSVIRPKQMELLEPV